MLTKKKDLLIRCVNLYVVLMNAKDDFTSDRISKNIENFYIFCRSWRKHFMIYSIQIGGHRTATASKPLLLGSRTRLFP